MDEENIFRRLFERLYSGLSLSRQTYESFLESLEEMDREMADRGNALTVLACIEPLIENDPEILAYCLNVATLCTFDAAFAALPAEKQLAIMGRLANMGIESNDE